MSGAPGNRSVAVEQHKAGEAHAWDACSGCGATRGEQCYSLRPSRALPEILGVKRPHKQNPCAGRPWQPRKPETRTT